MKAKEFSPAEKVSVLQIAYPSPVSIRDAWEDPEKDNYCVGGAYCLAKGLGISFPWDDMLAWEIKEENPNLPWDLAHQYARAITSENDKGNFELAWKCLQEALEQEGD